MTRDESSIAALRHEFSGFLPPPAVDWLCDLFKVIQVIDDFADGDSVSRADLNGLLWKSLVSLPANPFFQQYAHSLIPLLQNVILRWQASDHIERNGMKDHLPKAYVWRAGFYDIALQCFLLVHGEDAATRDGWQVLTIYGEKLSDYLAEFDDA